MANLPKYKNLPSEPPGSRALRSLVRALAKQAARDHFDAAPKDPRLDNRPSPDSTD